VPIATQCIARNALLFDHPIGASQKERRHAEPDRLRSIEIHHQIKPGRLLDWQVSRLGAGRSNAARFVCGTLVREPFWTG
jgi:hypothetical protein